MEIQGDAVQDPETGDWRSGDEPGWKFFSACREETNGKGSNVVLHDGRTKVFSSLIQCPKGTEHIPEGTQIKVCNEPDPDSFVRITGECMKSDVGQLHTRVWV